MATMTEEQKQKGRENLVKARAAAKVNREAKAEVPSDLDSKLDTILQGMAGISDRLDVVEAKSSTFVPMVREEQMSDRLAGTYQPDAVPTLKSMTSGLNKAGDTASGHKGALDRPGEIAKLPPQYRPKFRSGQMVRINPESWIWEGRDDEGNPKSSRRWGEMLTKLRIDGVGEILHIQMMDKTWQPKYTVFIRGLTKTTGDGFRESELLRV